MKKIIPALLLCAAAGAQAADWSDTSLSVRTGNKFAEPFGRTDISKNILNFSHVSGYKYGTNFFSIDYLMSDKKDPDLAGNGAREFYAVYRNTVDLEKAAGISVKNSLLRGMGVTAGFDANSKNDIGYNSKKQMLVLGPTWMVDVPGFLNVSLLQLWESNAPCSYSSTTAGACKSRYSYDAHPMLNLAWGIPFKAGSVPLSFEGYANFITAKGKNEYGGDTAAETLIDMQVMYDISGNKTFKVGFEYQWWKNKFGNDYKGAAGPGAFAKTPMLRAEYHF